MSNKKPEKPTPFADFIINASSAQKKKVYRKVLDQATASQNHIIEAAKNK